MLWKSRLRRSSRCRNCAVTTVVMNIDSAQMLSDEQLLRDIEASAAREHEATAQLIALLAEMDWRRLYLAQGFSSLFVYCTRHLHLSEHAAYGRIEAARAARKFPSILHRLADGSMTLTTICLLSNYLTADNFEQLLDAAKHRSRRDVEEQVAALKPKPAVPSTIRKLPESTPLMLRAVEGCEAPPLEIPPVPRPASPIAIDPIVGRSRPSDIRPLAPERFKVQFTIGSETHRKLRAVQDLMRHVLPNGDIAQIFDRALTLLLRDVERRKLASAEEPRTGSVTTSKSRHVPAAVRRRVWARDQGQCAFVGRVGRCSERGFLEFHHLTPFAEGGPTTVDNLELRCRAHNNHEAREWFGVSRS